MLQRTSQLLKKGWTHNPGRTRRGGKNLAWRPKIPDSKLEGFVPLSMVFPRRHLNSWHQREFSRLGLVSWPKEVSFYNSGDNLEVTPEMMWRLFKRNADELFWTPSHNEKTIVHLMPLVEAAPKEHMPRVDEIFRHHVKRFGADHVIYNAVMQALAFAKDYERCLTLHKEMGRVGLAPNTQTVVNLMLAAKLCGKPKETAEAFFTDGIRTGAIEAVMRLDVEFQMWWDQLERLGSFTSTAGHLSVKDEGAKPMPKNVFALWGWDRSERKFVSRKEAIREQVQLQTRQGRHLFGTAFTKHLRQPWASYKGMLPFDYKGPAPSRESISFEDAPNPHASASSS
jgi:pentatricopeptide repeat protein